MNGRRRWQAVRIPVVAAVLLAAAGPGSTEAQTVWEDLERPQGVRVELHHPELSTDAFGGLSSVAFFGGRIATSRAFSLVADLPVAFADVEVFDESDVAIGAPYLGFELRRPGWLVEGGIRVPIAGENFAAGFGSAVEVVDRPWAFTSNAMPVRIAGVWGGTSAGGFVHRFRLGPQLLVPTGGGDVELLVDYAGVIGYDGRTFGVEGGVAGWGLVTEDVGDLGARTIHELGIQAYRRMARGGRLALLLRLPLDTDSRDLQDFTLGLVASFAM